MAVSSVRTLVPLDRFARVLSFSPILFNQIALDGMQQSSACVGPILQYTWDEANGGMPGRDEMAEAIAQAEQMVERELSFAPMPTWYKDRVIIPVNEFPGGGDYGARGFAGYGPFYGLGAGAAGGSLQVVASDKYVHHGGLEVWSTIELAAPIVYTDTNSDGWFETATVVVNLPTGVTDVNEIAVYYPGTTHDYAWELRPIKVSITTGTPDVATITFGREQALLPDHITRLDARAVDGFDNANFLTTVDVYRHYNDPSQMAIVEWENGCYCTDTACVIYAQSGCINVLNPTTGRLAVHAGTYDADTVAWTHTYPAWWGRPDRVRAFYRAGYKDSNLARPMCEMTPSLERAIVLLALTLMDRQWENCEQLHNLQTRWRVDLAEQIGSQAQSTSYKMSRQDLENPFGTTRAAVNAWHVVQRLFVGEAVQGG